ncbi:MAG: hypothetical protein OXU71_11060 [Gammaproteobacteria bacterium]|nr:hypothetical protein [Gammaproteobacteria bacterium]
MFNTLNKIVQYIEQNCTAAETAGMPHLDSPEPARHGGGKKRNHALNLPTGNYAAEY